MARSIALMALVCTAVPAKAAIDSLVPLPKEVEPVGDPVPIDGFRIVADSDERSRIGADEINQRITSLGGLSADAREG